MQNVSNDSAPSDGRLDLSAMAQRAGIPHPTTVSQKVALFYGLNPQAPFDDRQDLYDLVWAVASALSGCLPTRSQVSETQKVFWVEFTSFMSEEIEPREIQIVATLTAPGTDRARLHLSLANETSKPPYLVLVVEDYEPIASLIAKLLENAGIEAITAGTGAEALRFIAVVKPDLILLDYDLPDVNGFDVLRVLKGDPALRAVPVIICSGRTHLREEALALGAVDCLEKPGDIRGLPARVMYWLSWSPAPASANPHAS